MTLIIKELIIRGTIVKDDIAADENTTSNKEILELLGTMKKSIKKECIDAVLLKLESKYKR